MLVSQHSLKRNVKRWSLSKKLTLDRGGQNYLPLNSELNQLLLKVIDYLRAFNADQVDLFASYSLSCVLQLMLNVLRVRCFEGICCLQ